VENRTIFKSTLITIFIAALISTSAFADFIPLTEYAPIPAPTLIGTGQFGTTLVGPVSVDFEAAGAFSGTLIAAAYKNNTNTTFIYHIEMDSVPVGSIDKFRLATAFPPDLAIDEITSVGYNSYLAGLDPNTAPARCWTGVDGLFTVIDFDFLNSPDDTTGLLSGTVAELVIETTNNVDVSDVYAIFIDSGTAAELTIGGVVTPGSPPQVPEPFTVVMMIAGVVGVAGIARKKLR